jgi:hypothetical protein
MDDEVGTRTLPARLTDPSCRAVTAATMASPSPVLPASCCRASSPRWKECWSHTYDWYALNVAAGWSSAQAPAPLVLPLSYPPAGGQGLSDGGELLH